MRIGVVRARHLPALSRDPQQDLLTAAFYWNSRFTLGLFRPTLGLEDTRDSGSKCVCPDEAECETILAWEDFAPKTGEMENLEARNKQDLSSFHWHGMIGAVFKKF
jgi:hypothetical protein